jgi:hypothetical protein
VLGSHDKEILQELKYIHEELETANTWLVLIAKALVKTSVYDFTLRQLSHEGASTMINGTVVGTSSTFQIGFVPATNFIPLSAGPTVSVDDTNVTLGPVSTDGQFTFTASVAAGDTGTSYNLTISGTNDKGVAVTHVFNVPILPTPPPPPVSITDFSLTQLS